MNKQSKLLKRIIIIVIAIFLASTVLMTLMSVINPSDSTSGTPASTSEEQILPDNDESVDENSVDPTDQDTQEIVAVE